jgi:hypothetical protein
VSITPTTAANLVRVTAQGILEANGGNICYARVIRGTSGTTSIGALAASGPNGNGFNQVGAFISGLDAPSTASSQTYTGQRAANNAATTCSWPNTDGITTNLGYMMAEEIQG